MRSSARSSLGFLNWCASENLKGLDTGEERKDDGRQAMRGAVGLPYLVKPLPSSRSTIQQRGSSASSCSKSRTYSKRLLAMTNAEEGGRCGLDCGRAARRTLLLRRMLG